MWLILAESDILPDYADGLGSDVEERGYVLQGKVLNNAVALQLVTLVVSYRLTLTLAKLAQHLKVYLVLLKFIFHSSVRIVYITLLRAGGRDWTSRFSSTTRAHCDKAFRGRDS